jgi:hypothetical protein
MPSADRCEAPQRGRMSLREHNHRTVLYNALGIERVCQWLAWAQGTALARSRVTRNFSVHPTKRPQISYIKERTP